MNAIFLDSHAAGQAMRLEARRPMPLVGGHRLWRVDRGYVDVFAVTRPDGARSDDIEGVRHHLARLAPGDVFWGVEASPVPEIAFAAVGGPDAMATRFKLENLPCEALAGLLQQWVEALSGKTLQERFPAGRGRRDLLVGQETEAAAGEILVPPNKALRAVVLAGQVESRGAVWARGESFLLLPGQRLTVRIDVRVKIDRIADCPWTDLEGLLQPLHSLLIRELATRLADEKARALDKLRRRAQLEETALDDSLRALGALVSPDKQTRGGRGADQALLEAVRLVAEATGVDLAESGLDSRQGMELDDLARRNGFFYRQVQLEPGWRRKDCGPLLGFLAGDDAPVALIPRSTSSYALIDPTGPGKPQRVTARTEKRLNPAAFVFYRQFPVRPLGLRDILAFAWPSFRAELPRLALAGALVGLLGLLTPILTASIMDHTIPMGDVNQLLQAGLLLLAAAVSVACFTLARNYATLRLEGLLSGRMQAAVFARLVSLPPRFFKDFATGDLINRALGVNQIRQMFSGLALNAFLGLGAAAFDLALLFYYDAALAAVALGLVLAHAGATAALSLWMVRYKARMLALAGRNESQLLEFFTGVAKLQAAAAQDAAFVKWAQIFGQRQHLALQADKLNAAMDCLGQSFLVLSTMVIYACYLGLEGQRMGVGSFMAFVSAFAVVQVSVLSVTLSLASVLNIAPLYRRALPILEAAPEADLAHADPGPLSGAIEVSRVSFAYDGGPSVLDDVSLQVRPGEFVAVAGASGSGKSTLLRLLLGFEQPSAGSVLYDGQSLIDLDLRLVRHQIGAVLQNGGISPGSIFQNIAGSSLLSREEVWEAVRAAGLEEDVKAMPMGLNTFLCEGGSNLSGGQRQRVLIARAMASKPSMVFLDEATSALDNRTQDIVAKSVASLNVSRVVIAHRLSTIRDADVIYVLDKGRVVESGTYDELMARKEHFHRLVQRQTL